MRRAALAVSVYLLVLAAASPFLSYRLEPPADATVINAAQFVMDDAPGQSMDVTLPHEWRETPDDTIGARYTLEFELGELPERSWAVALPTVRYTVGVSVNGVAIGDAGSMTQPVARNARRALVFTLPTNALREGGNRLDIDLRRAPDGIGYLDRVLVGPELPLRSRVTRHNLLRITLPAVITVLVLVMSGVIGVLAYVRRSEPDYFFYFLGTLVWALHSVAYFVTDIPVSDRLFDWLRFTTMGLFAYVAGVLYVHRYMGLRLVNFELRVLLLVVAGAVAMMALEDPQFYVFAYYGWHPFCLLMAGYGLGRMAQRAWHRSDLELHVIASSAVALTVFGTHDLLTTWGVTPWHRGYVLHYAMAYALGLFCAVLLRRFVSALNEAERLNHDLEVRVHTTRTELDRTFRENQQLENRRVVAEERDRIMRDMHDGMGGQLITTLAMIDDKRTDMPQIAQSLRSALQDLRLMIDSLDVAGEDITTMLGMFRSRIEPSLNAHDIKLSWQVEPIGEIAEFGSAKALHVLRILQEAVTNVIKHAAASEVTLSAKDRARAGGGRQVTIEVRDNGTGLKAPRDGGRGLSNMKSRALNIGAMLNVTSEDNGTTVSLKLRRQ
ncbi:MAG: sensor histidine kinase [Gammaproteobacteria bacterium]